MKEIFKTVNEITGSQEKELILQNVFQSLCQEVGVEVSACLSTKQ
jgi:tRNA U34 5-carboxymethylaminomethyl modifying GTPase MnmE/TrmE